MNYRKLFLWVEGEDDKRFFEKIIEPEFRKKYNSVETRCYATLKKDKLGNFLKSIKAMKADYIFVADINDSPCITAKKQKITKEWGKKIVDRDKIVVVIKEIESWYLAGLKDAECKKFNMPIFDKTDDVTKEQFNSLIPTKKFNSRIDFMIEILNNFSIEVAVRKNRSFSYFIEKYTSEVSGNIANYG